MSAVHIDLLIKAQPYVKRLLQAREARFRLEQTRETTAYRVEGIEFEEHDANVVRNRIRSALLAIESGLMATLEGVGVSCREPGQEPARTGYAAYDDPLGQKVHALDCELLQGVLGDGLCTCGAKLPELAGMHEVEAADGNGGGGGEYIREGESA